MYSVVLMVALTTSTDAVDFGHRNRCSGSCSCSGYSGHGGHRCHGGYGGCYGGYGGCYGGYGSYGCSGYGGYGCSGYGGYGGCTGGMGGYGCSGYGGYGCTGGVGGYGCAGGMGGYGGGVIIGAPAGGTVTPGGAQPEPLRTPPKKTNPEEASAPAPATILVSLPANAKLTINGSPTTSTSGLRQLVSPPLERGSTYVYTLRAELNGQTQSQDVRVTPGQTTQAQFNFPTSAVAGR